MGKAAEAVDDLQVTARVIDIAIEGGPLCRAKARGEHVEETDGFALIGQILGGNRPSNPVPRRCRGLQRSTTCLSSPNDTRQPGSFSQSTLAVF